jgi:ABC-2 type transport system permease protein
MTMGSFVEEKRSGHLELMMTFQLEESALILGKYLGIFSLYLLLLLPIWIYPIAVSTLGDLDWGIFICSLMGLTLSGMFILSIGLLMSLISNGLISAWAFTFFPSISLFLTNRLSLQVEPKMAKILQSISLEWHYSQFCKGIFDLRSFFFFFILTFFILSYSYLCLKNRKVKLNVI